MTTRNNAIGTFFWFVFDLVGMAKNKTLHKQIIGNWYKYWWDWSNLNNTNYNKEHLLCFIVMTSTQHSPRTISKQLDEDKKKEALFEERYLIDFLSTPL